MGGEGGGEGWGRMEGGRVGEKRQKKFDQNLGEEKAISER